MKKNLLFLILVINALMGYSQKAYNNNIIKCFSEDSISSFALPGVNATVLGSVFIEKSKYPSMFLQSDNWYPAIYLYECMGLKNGVPYYDDPVSISMPSELGYNLNGDILEIDGAVYGFWIKGKQLIETRYNEDDKSFEQTRLLNIEGLDVSPSAVSVWKERGKLYCLLEVGDGKKIGGPVHWENKDFPPYDSRGFFVGNLVYSGLYGFIIEDNDVWPISVKAVPQTDLKQVMWGYKKISYVTYPNGEKGVITGSHNGNFLYYPISGHEDRIVENRRFVVDENDILIRHNTIWARPIPFYNDVNDHIGMIVSGEGGIYYYPFAGFNKQGNPIYGKSRALLAYQSDLYGGSLIVPNLVDWDGDGDLDMIVGNSIGNVNFFENEGSNSEPKFKDAVPLCVYGKPIHIQPGYKDDIQGPQESRWGYVCPTVVDWNNDGLLDIITNDSRGKHRIFLNIGEKGRPVLDSESPLYLDGLEFHGTWRTRPGVARLGERMAYITQDEDDEFHLYWQIDTYNLEDGGKLKLTDGSFIGGSYFGKGGGTGRNKILIIDWDDDGVKDLLVGTPRYGTIPNKQIGLPFNAGDKGAAVLFLRNAGTNNEPVYDFPKMIKYLGKTIHFGQHSCAPTVGNLKTKDGLDLIVGDQKGRFYFFERKDLSW